MSRRWQAILAFGLLAVFVAAWLFMSWLRWADCLVDFGRELYIPWQISQGKVLYRDLYFYYGPLVKYFHAFLFQCFGASLTVLVITNFIILLVTCFAVYFLFKFLKGFWAGLIAVYLFLGIFAFGHYTEIGNYNYICPYSHELVYGQALSFIGLLTIGYWFKNSRFIYLALTGLLTGLIFLTKIEIFIAFAGAVVLAFTLDALCKRVPLISYIKRILTILCFTLIAPVIFVFYMSHQASFHEALNFLFQPFDMARRVGDANWVFYKKISGLDDPRGNSLLVLKSTGRYIFLAFMLGAFSYLTGCFKNKRIQIFLILLLGIIDVLIAAHIKTVSVALIFRGMPLILIGIIAIDSYRLLKGFFQGKNVSDLIFRIVLSAYSLLLILKIILYVTPLQYGFVLAAPGALVIAIFLSNDVACFGRGRFYSPKVFRALAILFFLGVLIVHFRWSKGFYEHINYPVSQGQDRFFSVDRDVAGVGYKSVLINTILQWTDKNTSSQDTLVVMPEGVMINYLSRRQNPLLEYEFPPDLLGLLDEGRIIDSFQKTSPTYIILIHRNMLEHGAGTFGLDYGQRIYQWILGNYENVFIWGDVPSKENNYSRLPEAFLMRRIK